MGKKIALLGDLSDHGGTLISTNQDDRASTTNIAVCVDGCSHSCPIPLHGITPVTAVTTKSYINGKLIITEGATAGCEAVITPSDRRTYIE